MTKNVLLILGEGMSWNTMIEDVLVENCTKKTWGGGLVNRYRRNAGNP
jgi:hypothetical protein